tara:strand:+ start:1072 stop:1590 length:519 start_codon:yes stop_codon:yes gene_type:complete
MVSNIKRFILFIFLIAAFDQITKLLVIHYFEIDVKRLNSTIIFYINEYLNFYIIWNKGFAFGLFQNDIDLVNNIYMVLILTIIIILFVYALQINRRMYYFSFSLIIGGAIGNLIDRFSYNAVLDFIDLHYNNYHWYVFNIADITITTGCILTIILELFFKEKENKNQNEIDK